MISDLFAKQPVAISILRVLLGVIFTYAGISKITEPLNFADNIASYHLLSPVIINLLAMSLPIFEIACGLSVLTSFYIRLGSMAMIAMLIIFSLAMVWAIVRELPISCGCFGEIAWLDTNPWFAVSRDLLLLCLSIIVYRHHLFKLRPIWKPSQIKRQAL